MMRWAAWLLSILVATVATASGCAEERDDGTTPSPEATLPPLTLTDDTPELLLTWIDQRGGTATGVTLSDVPEASKSMVRVVTRDAGHGAQFYVADLRHKAPDGSYPVRVMKRSAWEAELQKRRDAFRAKNAPTPRQAPSGGPNPRPAPHGSERPAAGDVHAIIYGAAWCKPCHQAAAHLKRQRVTVVEHDIEKHPSRAAEMRRKLKAAGMGGGSIPVIDVGGTILRGFNPRALDQAVARVRNGRTRL